MVVAGAPAISMAPASVAVEETALSTVAAAVEPPSLTELAGAGSALMVPSLAAVAGGGEETAAILPKVQRTLEAALEDIQRVAVVPDRVPSEERVAKLLEREEELHFLVVDLARREQ